MPVLFRNHLFLYGKVDSFSGIILSTTNIYSLPYTTLDLEEFQRKSTLRIILTISNIERFYVRCAHAMFAIVEHAC